MNPLCKDLATTKNRRLINYIIDEFLMSDYAFWDVDHGYSDFWSAEGILNKVIDEPIFVDARIFSDNQEDRKLFIRNWLSKNRDTYKIKK